MTLATALVSGATLRGRYRLDTELGRGAMGVVFRARDLELARDVAVKVLAGSRDDQGHQRLLQEARMAATLNHPRVVAVYDVGIEQGAPYVVMELVPGGSLRALGRLEPSRAVEVARQLCEALVHAHDHGIVHRDLKPENVLIADPQAPAIKLADLGVAFSDDGSTRMTSDGAIVGTAHYLSPEQALGLQVDGRADLYALGVVLYELVTGRLPFQGLDPLAVISQHLNAPVVPPRTFAEGVAPALEAVILKLLAKDAAQRYADAREVERALTEAGRDATAAPAADTGTLGQLVRGRLVGRARELEQLREMWRARQRGGSQLALVSGEPGAGKTRLAHEAMVYARVSGATVLQGGCYEYEAATPYLPAIEALRAWSGAQTDEALRDALGDSAPEIARLVPAIGRRLGSDDDAAPHAAGPEQRLRLFDAIARFLQRAARDGGVLLFVDDLHWADQGTLALLHYLLRNLREERVLVLATSREVELDRQHPLAAALVEWERERLSTRVQVGRLDEAATAAMLAVLLDQETVTPAFAHAVHRETEGNPFFVEEVLKSLVEQGQIYRRGLEWHRGDIADLAIPQSVKAAIGRRLDRLTPACGEVLHTAAALGKSFGFDDLLAASGHGEDALLDALDEAMAAQLIAARGADAFVFTHDKIREVLYEEMNAIRRRRLHQRIGEALEKRRGDAPEAAAALAHHFFESGDLERALRYSRSAAAEAVRVFAHEEAVGHLERALECAEALGRLELRVELEESAGEILLEAGNSLTAARAFERALGHAEDPRRRAHLKFKAGESHGRTGEPSGRLLLEQARAELDPETQRIELAQTIASLGRYDHYDGHPALATEKLLEALEMIGPDGPSEALGTVYSYLAGAYQHLGEIDRSCEYARRSIAMGEARKDLRWIANGAEFLAENASGRGQWRETLHWAEVDRDHGARIHNLDRVTWSRFSRQIGERGLGRLADALVTLETCEAECDRIGEVRLRRLTHGWHAMLLADLGRRDEALEWAKRAIEESEKGGQQFLKVVAWISQTYVFWHLRRLDEARDAAKTLRGLLRDSHYRWAELWRASIECYVAIALEAWDDADAQIAPMLGLATEIGAEPTRARLEAAAALVRHGRGQRDGVIEGLDSAVATLEATESMRDLSFTLLDRARVLRELGQVDRSRADAARVVDRAGSMGARLDRERALAFLE